MTVAHPVLFNGETRLQLLTRVRVEDVQLGDIVARAKSHEFFRVFSIDEGPVSRRLHLERGDKIRPRRTALLWKIDR